MIPPSDMVMDDQGRLLDAQPGSWKGFTGISNFLAPGLQSLANNPSKGCPTTTKWNKERTTR